MHFRTVWLPEEVPGRLFLSSMPGRYEPLEEAILDVKHFGITGVISLAPLGEIEEKSPSYHLAVMQDSLGCSFECHPIEDFGVPSDRALFSESVRRVADSLTAGERLLVHCGAGIGRTGTFACCVLISLGTGLKKSLEILAESGSHPETQGQEELIAWFSRGV